MSEADDNTEIEKELEAEKPEEPKVEKEEKVTMVPHQALHEQRLMNKQLQQQLKDQQETASRMESTFQKLLSNLNEKPAPKMEDDPLGHIAARNDVLEKEIRQLGEKLDGQAKHASQTQIISQLTAELSASEAEFRATKPDYDAAVKYLKDVTRSDLADQGVSGPEVEQTLNAGKLGLARSALAVGKDPAQALYERALRYGFKSKASGDKLETLAKGQGMAKTVDGGGGGGMTLKDLAQLPDDQIDELCRDEKKFQALIRGQTIR